MHLIILLALFSQITLAQLNTGTGSIPVCDENTFTTQAPTSPNNTYDCVDVFITTNLTPPLNDLSNAPLTILATGNVTIDGDILFQGADAININGGIGGPGGGFGGTFFPTGNPGLPANADQLPNQAGNNPSAGAAFCSAPPDAGEGSGGGGGSLILKGDPGKIGGFTSGSASISPSGDSGDVISLDLNNFKFAGAGGGTGEAGCDMTGNFTTGPAGAGGGGGGGIRIIAAGEITVNGTIDVSGGNGSSGTGLAGGGGGGSGGFIILQSDSKIHFNKTFYALAGKGGKNFSLSVEEGDGGAGAPGFIMLQDQSGTRTFDGFVDPPAPLSPSKQSLNSDISCGTIAKSEESHSNALMLMAIGFLLALGTKILFQFPMKLSRKFVHRN